MTPESSAEATQMVRQEVLEALRLCKNRQYEEAVRVLQEGIETNPENEEERAVLYSTLGMILKKLGKTDEAWEAYQNAENCLPDDPFLKIIVARFLINERRQFDQSIRKAKQVLKIAKEVPSIRHQAYTLLGLAYLRKGQAKKAGEMLDHAMEDKFEGMATAENIDFNLVEAMLREKLEIEKCQRFMQAAYNLARSKKEYAAMTTYRKILDSFEVTHV